MTTEAALGGEAGRADREQERWYLNDQRDFLLRSIDDAAREHNAGDLSQADYDVLVARDRERLAAVESELAALGPVPEETATPSSEYEAPMARRRVSLGRRIGIVVACLLILLGAGILVDHAVSPSLPGQALTGSITESKVAMLQQQLAEAVILNNQGMAVRALQLYDKVLTEDPDDPTALAASGWLEWNYGNAGRKATLTSAGRAAEKKAIHFGPTYYAGHLFLGLILFNQDHDATGAVTQFTMFLADSPPPAEVKSVAPQVASAYSAAGLPIPAALATVLVPTSTTSTSTP